MPKVLTIGDVVIDHFITLPAESIETYCNIKDHKSELLLPFGEKIPVQDTLLRIGGNCANVTVGLTRLGVTVSSVMALGQDEFSNFALGLLEKEKISQNYINITENNKCDVHVILKANGERTILSEHTQKSYSFPQDINIEEEYIYLSSHSTSNVNMATNVLRLLNNERKFIFAPGNAQINGEREILEALISKSYLIICNRQEAYTILSKVNSKEMNILNMLHTFHHIGAKNVIITDGSNGAFYFDSTTQAEGHLDSIMNQKKIVDTTGAGDATCTGVIYGLLNKFTLERSLKLGFHNSASVLESVGAQTGLIRKSDLNNLKY